MIELYFNTPTKIHDATLLLNQYYIDKNTVAVYCELTGTVDDNGSVIYFDSNSNLFTYHEKNGERYFAKPVFKFDDLHTHFTKVSNIIVEGLPLEEDIKSNLLHKIVNAQVDAYARKIIDTHV